MSSERNQEPFIKIPYHVPIEFGLTGNEIIIYSTILGFTQAKDRCFHGGVKYLMMLTNASARTVINILDKLKQQSLIIPDRKPEYPHKVVYVATETPKPAESAPFKPAESAPFPNNKIKDHKLERSRSLRHSEQITDLPGVEDEPEQPVKQPRVPGEKALTAEFEKLWILYPNKKGKADALRYYIRERRAGTSYEDVERGIIQYVDWCSKQKEPGFEKGGRKVKHGSTYFNGRNWEDEYETGTYRDRYSQDKDLSTIPKKTEAELDAEIAAGLEKIYGRGVRP